MRQTAIDCADPFALAEFWRQVTGWEPAWDYEPHEEEAALVAPIDGAAGLYFNQVPEGKTVKNRLHLCLTPTDRTREEEVERLLGIGASLVVDRREPDGTGWAVLADPEGNEFCVLRSESERPVTP